MTMTVTDQLLHQLVVGSHAEGTTCLAVAAAIEHDDRTLLIAATDDDFAPVWQLPAGLVLPGETLLHGLDRVVTFTTGLGVLDVTGYAGHHDHRLDDEIVRTFVFTITRRRPRPGLPLGEHRPSLEQRPHHRVQHPRRHRRPPHPHDNSGSPSHRPNPDLTNCRPPSEPTPEAFSAPRPPSSC